jgi:methyl-accepting chemotaxis protein
MRKISLHLPIAAKAVLLIAALGVMSAAANWFCLRSLHEIDRINATVTQRVEPARLALTEAKIAVESLGLATYKMAGSNDPATVREATDERAGQFAAAKVWLNGVLSDLPGHEEDVSGMLRRLDLSTASPTPSTSWAKLATPSTRAGRSSSSSTRRWSMPPPA